jgi:hypothetical protein
MGTPMISITSPESSTAESSSFTATGTCSMSGTHTVTASLSPGDYSGSVTQDGSSWSAAFTNVPAGTYTLTAGCGDKTTQVTNITVS